MRGTNNLAKLTAADFLVRTAYQMCKTPLLPLMAATLGADAFFLGMIVSVSTLTGMGLKPLFGLLSDRWGRWSWLLGGTLLFAGMPFFYQLIENPGELLLLRLVHGLATAIYGPVTLAWVAEQDSSNIAERLGWFGMARSGGYLIGPSVAAALLTFMDPVSIFTVIGLLSITALLPVMMLRSMENLATPTKITWGKQFREALKSGLSLNEFWFAGSLECVVFLGIYAMKAFLPLLALEAGIAILWVGIFFSLQELTHILMRPFGGRLGDRYGHLLLAVSGMLLAAFALGLLPFTRDAFSLLPISLLFGAAQALIFPSTLALFTNRINPRHTGSGAGLLGSMKNLGKVAGPVMGGWMVHTHEMSWMLWSMSSLLVLTGFSLLMFTPTGKKTIFETGR